MGNLTEAIDKVLCVCVHGHSFEARKLNLCMKVKFYWDGQDMCRLCCIR